jgi:hypothetical protein
MKPLEEIESTIKQLVKPCYTCEFRVFRASEAPCSKCSVNTGNGSVYKPDNARIKKIAEYITADE